MPGTCRASCAASASTPDGLGPPEPSRVTVQLLWIKVGPLLPLDTGGKIRTHAMLTELARQHQVTWLGLRDPGEPVDPAEDSAPYAREKFWVDHVTPQKRGARFFLTLAKNQLLSRQPYALERYRSKALQREIQRLCRQRDFDLVVCDFLAPALNVAPLARRLRPHTVLFQHNMEALIWQRLAAAKTNPLARSYFQRQARRMARAEAALSRRFDGVITVSPDDSRIAREHYGLTNVLGHVPTGVDTNHFQPMTRRAPAEGDAPVIGFLGSMDWMPNMDAVDWFLADIWPQVRKRCPGARFRIIGRNPSTALQQRGATDPAIEVTGTVDDVRPYVAGCDLMVVPLRAGGGTRLKIPETMAMGVATLSTQVGAEGLQLPAGTCRVVSEQAAALTDAIVELLNDRSQLRSLARKGREHVCRNHSWAAAARTFAELIKPNLKLSR